MPAAPPPSSRTSGPSPSTTWCRATASARATSCSPCRRRCRRSASRIRCTSTATISGCRAAPTPRITTIEAAGDLPMHLAHLQFYGYGTEGKRGISSAARAARRAGERARRTSRSTSGQVMFGPTVTVSSDTLRQFAPARLRPAEEVDALGRRRKRRRRSSRSSIGEQRLRQRAAMGDRAGAVPADRRSLAGLFHHRPSERRALHRAIPRSSIS